MDKAILSKVLNCAVTVNDVPAIDINSSMEAASNKNDKRNWQSEKLNDSRTVLKIRQTLKNTSLATKKRFLKILLHKAKDIYSSSETFEDEKHQ